MALMSMPHLCLSSHILAPRRKHPNLLSASRGVSVSPASSAAFIYADWEADVCVLGLLFMGFIFECFQSEGGGLHSRPPQCLIAKSSEHSELLPGGESNPAPLHISYHWPLPSHGPTGSCLLMKKRRCIRIFLWGRRTRTSRCLSSAWLCAPIHYKGFISSNESPYSHQPQYTRAHPK